VTIESLLTEISERGWFVYSARECDHDRTLSGDQWQVTLTKPDAFTGYNYVSYGQATTLALALASALDNIESAERKIKESPTYVLNKTPSVDLSSILTKLSKPLEPIKRRI